MVNYSSAALDRTFSALADPTRRAILSQLTRGECSVSRLAEPFEISLPGVLKHLSVLARARLITQEKNGRVRRCRLTPDPMKNAAEWIASYRSFWEQRFDALAEYLRQAQKKEAAECRPQKQVRKPARRSGAPLRRRGKRPSERGRNSKC